MNDRGCAVALLYKSNQINRAREFCVGLVVAFLQ